MMRRIIGVGLCLLGFATTAPQAESRPPGQETERGYDYRVLATTRTSTMEREMNAAAAEGYRFQSAMGGETAFGGSELVSMMMRGPSSAANRFSYRVLATNRTSTMEEEMREAGAAGYDYRGQTVFDSLFGGDEVVVVMERDHEAPDARYDYRLLATNRTSTMENELNEAGRDGFQLVGVTVGETAFGGGEVVAICRRHGR